MKTIRNCLAAVLAVASIIPLQAEWTHKVRLEGDAPNGRLNIAGMNGDITIEGVDGNELSISSPDIEVPEVPEKPAPPRTETEPGLRSLLNVGRDNSGLGLQVEVRGAQVDVTSVRPHEAAKYFFKVPRAMSLHLAGVVHGDVAVTGMGGDMEIVVAEGGIQVAGAKSSLVLHSVNGEINVGYSSYPEHGPGSINAVNGAVRVELPEGAKANLELRTINGDIFTDLPLDVKKRHESNWGGPRSVVAALNGGGEKLTINAINQDVIVQRPKE